LRSSSQPGLPLWGLCVYPILDHPCWDDDRNVKCGLWGYEQPGERVLEPDLAAALLEGKSRLECLSLPALELEYGEKELGFRKVW